MGIQVGSAATVIDNRGGKGQIATGSLFNEPQFYSGFWLIHAKDDSQALDLATQASRACNRRVELRPYIQ
jgi:hypothetical protein